MSAHQLSPDARADRRARVVELTHQGLTAPVIAELLHTTERTVQRDRVAAGVAQVPPEPFTDDEVSRAEALLADGCSYSEVGRTLGRSDQAVRRRFLGQGYGWSRGECVAFALGVRWGNYDPPRRAAAS